jgi:hypothetical protein
LTVGCLETEGENGDNVLPAIDKEIDKMFPPLRNTLANDIEVMDFAMKDPLPVFQAEGVAAVRQSGSADTDNEFDEEDSGTKHLGNKVGGAMSTKMEAMLILRRFWSKQASLTLTSPSLFAKTTDKGSYFCSSDEDNDFIPEEEPTEGFYDDDELFQDDKEEDLVDLLYYCSVFILALTTRESLLSWIKQRV